MTRNIIAIVLAFTIPALVGCGKKGDTLPPEGYQEPGYKRAPELEPGPMDEQDDKEGQDDQ